MWRCPFAAHWTVLPHLNLTKAVRCAVLQMRKSRLQELQYFIRDCSAGRADVHADFPLITAARLIMEQAFWVCSYLLPIHPGEEESCAVSPGLAVGTLFRMVTVLLCCLSWNVWYQTGDFDWAGNWLRFCPQRGRLMCASTTRGQPLERYRKAASD